LLANAKSVIELDPKVQDSTEARRLLRQFEETHALHVADRERLEEELAALD
jgi:hypothetical protein